MEQAGTTVKNTAMAVRLDPGLTQRKFIISTEIDTGHLFARGAG
jgi:hypothetical protein